MSNARNAPSAQKELRFEFGENWARFLEVVGEEHIAESVKALRSMLGVEDLAGKTFLDAGSGSGLSSLAARRLGAKVFSFDYDRTSVASTAEMKRRYYPDDEAWTVTQGSVLDVAFLEGLGRFDVVYSWGVLHHTGQMWRAMELVSQRVAPDGTLFISIYNHQRVWSRVWTLVKRTYNSLPGFLRVPFAILAVLPIELRALALQTLTLHPWRYLEGWTNYRRNRGMSRWHDIIDWVGGYPFEVAKPEEVFLFLKQRGFRLENLKTCGAALGCNEYVLSRVREG